MYSYRPVVHININTLELFLTCNSSRRKYLRQPFTDIDVFKFFVFR